jgi:DNA-binding response OmpR family regulator
MCQPDSPKDPRHIVIIHARCEAADDLGGALRCEGFDVRVLATFQEVEGWLTRHRDSVVLILQPSAMDTFRATLEAVRRLARSVPIVAVVPSRATHRVAVLRSRYDEG